MKTGIKLKKIKKPIKGEQPAGVDLRRSDDNIYKEILEAKQEDDTTGLSESEKKYAKKADWAKVTKLCYDALISKSKDLELAAWLTHSLFECEGINGLTTGLRVVRNILSEYWEDAYPLIEDDDLDYRANPINYINEQLSNKIKTLEMTEGKTSKVYTFYDYEKNSGSDEIQLSINQTSTQFYKKFSDEIELCIEEIVKLKQLVNEKFIVYKISETIIKDEAFIKISEEIEDLEDIFDLEFIREDDFINALKEELNEDILNEYKDLFIKKGRNNANETPGLKKLLSSIEFCSGIINKILEQNNSNIKPQTQVINNEEKISISNDFMNQTNEQFTTKSSLIFHNLLEQKYSDIYIWNEILKIYKNKGFQLTLKLLLDASCSATSVRDKSRFNLLIAKLCIKERKLQIARPILEEIHKLISDLKINQWESPLWIAEVEDMLYKCLRRTKEGNIIDADSQKGLALFNQICLHDITKANEHIK